MGTLIDGLRRAVDSSVLSRNALAKSAGIPPSVLSRFMSGGGIVLDAADKLADALGLVLFHPGTIESPEVAGGATGDCRSQTKARLVERGFGNTAPVKRWCCSCGVRHFNGEPACTRCKKERP